MIVVDGRTDIEKLGELLHLTEQEALDYKTETDLSFGKSEKHRLDFIKDAVAMSNRPEGGYILFGVTNDGKPCQVSGTCKNQQVFDGANLSAMVRSYVDGEIRVVTQWHEAEGCEVLLAYIHGHRDGLPLPMTSIGQYPDPKKPGAYKIAFHEGQILVREGPGNASLRHAHWNGVLERYTTRIREEERGSLRGLLSHLNAATTPGAPRLALIVELPLDSFAGAVTSHLQANDDIALRSFMRTAEQLITEDGPTFDAALDRLTSLVLQCLLYERYEQANQAVDSLFRAFSRLGYTHASAKARLDIVTRLYVMGSLAVRQHAWGFLHDMVLRRALSPGHTDYYYSSWIRQAQVDASRAELLRDKQHLGLMISLARDLMQSEPMMRPDIPDAALAEPQELDRNDVLLNSLAQFDLLYCLVVLAEGKDHGDAYPACCAFSQSRIEDVANHMAADPMARAALLPNSSDAEIARAFQEVWELTRRQAFQVGGNWGSPPNPVQAFIASATDSP